MKDQKKLKRLANRESKKKVFSFWISANIVSKLDKVAEEFGVSRSRLTQRIIRNFVAEEIKDE